MYQTSAGFGEVISENNRTFEAKLTVGNTELPNIISVKQEARSCGNDCITIGGAISTSVEIEMLKPATQLKNQEFDLCLGLAVGNATEWVPMGKYTALKIKDDDGILKFTAYDRVQSKMSGLYSSQLEYPADGKALLKEISENTECPIRTDNLPDGVMIPKRKVSTETVLDNEGNEESYVTYTTPFYGYTNQEALGYIAQFYGKFAVADRSGVIEFRWYTETDYELRANRYYDDLTKEEQVFSIGAITCDVGNNTLETGNGTGCVFLENPVMTQDRLEAVYQQIAGLEFLPTGVSFLGDPRLDLGDVIKIYDKSNNLIRLPVMHILHDFDGGLITKAKSFGGSEHETSTEKGPTARALERTRAELFLVKELIAEKARIADIRILRAVIDSLFAQDITATGTIRGLTLLGTKGEIGGWTLEDNGLYAESPDGSKVVFQNVGYRILQTTKYSAHTLDEGRTGCTVNRSANGFTIIPQADGNVVFSATFPADPGTYSLEIVSTHAGDAELGYLCRIEEDGNVDYEYVSIAFEDPVTVYDQGSGSKKVWSYDNITLDGVNEKGPFEFSFWIDSVESEEEIELTVTITKDGEIYAAQYTEDALNGVPNKYILGRKIEEDGEISFPFHIDCDGLIYTENDIYENGTKLSERYMPLNRSPSVGTVYTNAQTAIYFADTDYHPIASYSRYSNSGNDITASGNGITVNKAGIYQLRGALLFSSVPSSLLGNVKRLQLVVNGERIGVAICARANSWEHLTVSYTKNLNAGDLVQLAVQCDNQSASEYCVPSFWNLQVTGPL